MEKMTLELERREQHGSRRVAELRKNGYIPAVVYAQGKPAISVSVNAREFVNAARKARTSTFFALKSSEPLLNNKRAFVKELQQDFVKKEIQHIDFIAVDPDVETHVKVPVEITGESNGVKNFGGVMTVNCHEVMVKGIPDVIPEILYVDVTPLNVGEHISAGDIKLPEGCTMVTMADEPIVLVASTAAEEEPKAAEGDAAAAAAAAPAKGGKKGK